MKMQFSFTCMLAVAFTALLSCTPRKPIITIVDIGRNNRLEIGRQLRIINKYTPKLIALDFFLGQDSLGRDSILVKEMNRSTVIIQGVGLHQTRNYRRRNGWDSLDISNPKFRTTEFGFLNLTTEDSVLVNELPMMQSFGRIPVYAFAYVIAQKSYGVKQQFIRESPEPINLELRNLGNNYKFISIKNLASGNFEPDDLRNRIVLMGYVGDKEDFNYTDKGKTRKINGVEVHAAIVEELLDF